MRCVPCTSEEETIQQWISCVCACVRARRGSGTTALHIAAQHNQVAACRYLLEQGADRKAMMLTGYTDQGRTALQLAKEEGFNEVVELLKTWTPDSPKAADETAKEEEEEDRLLRLSDESEGWIYAPEN